MITNDEPRPTAAFSLVKIARGLSSRKTVSVFRIQADSGLDEPTAQIAVSKLEAAGLVRKNEFGRLEVLKEALERFLMDNPDAVEPAPEQATAEKVMFSAPLAGRPRKPGHKSSEEELNLLLEGIQGVALPGILSEEERLTAIRDVASKIESMVCGVNSAVKRLELAGRRVNSQKARVLYRAYDPSEGGQGGIRLFVNHNPPTFLWEVIWEDGISQEWLNRKVEGCAAALKRHLIALGGRAAVQGR